MSPNDLEGIALVGSTLSPFYLQDPVKGEAAAAFRALSELDVPAACAQWPFVSDTDAAQALALMQEGLAEGTDADALVWEYRRLFVGPQALPAPPWGSVYTDRDMVVFGLSTLALRQWMREKGIVRQTDGNVPDDHIGLMLGLMSYLASTQPDDLPEYLRLHLLTWSHHYLDELEQAATHPFYRGLARLTDLSLEGIREELGIEVVYPRFYR